MEKRVIFTWLNTTENGHENRKPVHCPPESLCVNQKSEKPEGTREGPVGQQIITRYDRRKEQPPSWGENLRKRNISGSPTPERVNNKHTKKSKNVAGRSVDRAFLILGNVFRWFTEVGKRKIRVRCGRSIEVFVNQ